jgi:23S rRNA G2445 N2-methylase RlmL
MDGIIITNPGIEAVSGREVKELIGAECRIARSVAIFESKSLEDLCALCYCSQSAVKVMCLLFSGTIKGIDAALKELKKLDLSEWLHGKSFSVRSRILDNESLDTLESERLIGEVIYEKYGAKVDLEKPDIPFFAYFVGNEFYFGVDFAGFDMSKRTYRVFALSDSLKAPVGYALVRLAGYKPGMSLLDPFVQSGTVVIEAALFASKKPVNFYGKDKFAFLRFSQFDGFDFDAFFAKHDKKLLDVKGITASDSQQRHVKSAEKNAKIAGLNKQIMFTRMDVEWLDTKFDKESVDCIVSNPPKMSRLLSEKGFDKQFQELFYTADFVLKKEGKIVILAKNYSQIIRHAQRHHFNLKSNFPVWQGQEDLSILIFEKERK